MKTPANKEPVIINKLGDYITRSGKLVRIQIIKDHSNNYAVTRFNCKGYLITPRKDKKPKEEFNIWHESGQFVAVGEHPNDIIAAQ